MDADRTRWNDRYAEAAPPEATPPEVLRARPDLDAVLPREGRALDVACGTGAQTLWLAARGLHVVALDVADRAIEMLRDAAAEAGVGDRVDARVVDLDAGLPDDIGGVDILVCQRFRDPRRYNSFVQALRAGGVGIVTVLSEVGLDRDPGPFHAPAGELRAAFARDATEVWYEREGDGVASVVFRVRPTARPEG